MIKNCRYVIKGLQKISNSTDDVLGFLGNTTCICRADDYDITFDYAKYQGEIRSTIDRLVIDGYLKYFKNENQFTLTQLGLHPYLFRWESLKGFLFKSVFIPILVSAATTLVTLWIKALL